MRTFNCESCGTESTTRRANTKRCPLCRLLRDMIYPKTMSKRVCIACDTEFLPIKVGENLCGGCSEFTFGNSATPVGECAFCNQQKKLSYDDVAICHHCLRDPEHRQAIIRALNRKLQRRVSAQAPA